MEPFEIDLTMERAFLAHAKEKKVPIHGSLELLPLCNLNCDMCYVRLSRQEMEQKGRLRTAEEWIALGREMAKSGVLFLLLTGGEPLIFPEFKKLYLELRKMGMILTINTNGTLLDEEWAAFFGRHKPRRINITLYGANETTYEKLCHSPQAFNRVIRGIHLLKKEKVDVKLATSITRANEMDLERMLQLGRELEVPFRADTYMLPGTRERTKPFDQQARLNPVHAAKARMQALRAEMGDALFNQYAKQIKTEVEATKKLSAKCIPPRIMDCLAGNCSFSVNWQGELHPCVMLSSPAASVFEMGFVAAWEKTRKEIEKIRLHPRCTACFLRPLCRTCAASALFESGRYDGIPEYMCQYTWESWTILQEYLSK